MIHVEVVPAVRLRNIFVRTADIPLADPGAGVIARRCDSKHAHHGQDSAANVLPVEVATDANLFYLDFTGPELFGRPAHRMVLRLIEIRNKVSIESDFRSE